MKERLAERFAVKHQEVRMIDSEAKNLQYICVECVMEEKGSDKT